MKKELTQEQLFRNAERRVEPVFGERADGAPAPRFFAALDDAETTVMGLTFTAWLQRAKGAANAAVGGVAGERYAYETLTAFYPDGKIDVAAERWHAGEHPEAYGARVVAEHRGVR